MIPVPSFYRPGQAGAPATPSPLSNMAHLTPLAPAMDELPPLPTVNTKTNKRPSLSVKTKNTGPPMFSVQASLATSLLPIPLPSFVAAWPQRRTHLQRLWSLL